MAQKLFDHINAITTIQDPKYFDKLTDEDLKTWSNFMINRFLSMKPEWVECWLLADFIATSHKRSISYSTVVMLPKCLRFNYSLACESPCTAISNSSMKPFIWDLLAS